MSLKDRYAKLLNLQYLEGEGGYFRAIYRPKDRRIALRDGGEMTLEKGVPNKSDENEKGVKYRDLFSTIYYLMEKVNPPVVNISAHIHFYHDGCPVKYYWIEEGSKELKEATLGANVAEGHCLQIAIPAGALRWTIVQDDGVNDRCSLISVCAMPGFCFEDRTMFSATELQVMYPEYWDQMKGSFH